MKKFLYYLAICVMCFAFCSNVAASDIPTAQPPKNNIPKTPPSTLIQRAYAPTTLEIPLINCNKQALVTLTYNISVVVFKTTTTASSILIAAKYLSANVYRITINLFTK